MKRSYIGVVYWKDGGVLDNTREGGFLTVWQDLCIYNPLHAGRMTLHRAKYDKDGNIVARPIKEFVSVEDCKEQYFKTFNQNPPHQRKQKDKKCTAND